jgi:HlyD family secretion protein
VSFGIDAYPGQTFRGEVAHIRLNASMSQNVVSYTVIVTTDNSSGKLLPYMTANLQFEVARRTHALLVPNAALRWRPSAAQVMPQVRQSGAMPGPRRTAPPRDERSTKAGVGPAVRQGTLWIVADQGLVRPIPVKTGLSDGIMTEVDEGDLCEGTEVVVGEARLEVTQRSKLPFLSLRKKEGEN